MRKVTKTARNRTESYHQLQRAIRKVYSGVFKGTKIIDNAISNQATRLVANAIIAYNAMFLEEGYQRLVLKLGEKIAKFILMNISPVAWQHFLFTGRYHFKHKRIEVDISKLGRKVEKIAGAARKDLKPATFGGSTSALGKAARSL